MERNWFNDFDFDRILPAKLLEFFNRPLPIPAKRKIIPYVDGLDVKDLLQDIKKRLRRKICKLTGKFCYHNRIHVEMLYQTNSFRVRGDKRRTLLWF